MGAGLLAMGAISWPFAIAARKAEALPDEVRVFLVALYMVGMISGVALLCAFNHRVFRQGDGLGRTLWSLITGANVALAVAQTIEPGLLALARGRGGIWSLNPAVIGCVFAWGCVESTLYYGKLKKRLAIGLGDPAVAERFLLWSIGTGLAAATCALGMTLSMLGLDTRTNPIALLVIGVMGICMSTPIWIAFLPSPHYQRWRGRGREEGSDG